MINDTLNKDVTFKDIVTVVKDYWNYILLKYKIIIAIGLLGGCLGLLYSVLTKPIYTATLTFALEDEKSSGLGGALGLAGQFGFDLGGSGGGIFDGSNIIELFKSRTMIKKTLLAPITINGKTTSLAEVYI